MTATHQRLNVKHANQDGAYNLPKEDFAHWLVGVTDGDGCFSFSVNKKKNSIWNCTFKIGQSVSNLRMLHFIKKNLGWGKINSKSGKNMAEFRIRDRKTLLGLIVPIFTQYPLYSTKQFYFLQWVKALETLENAGLTSAEKNFILSQLKSERPTAPSSVPVKKKGDLVLQKRTISSKEKRNGKGGEETYISPSWDKGEPTDEWIHGFIEAEGSFFLTKKEDGARSKTSTKGGDLPVNPAPLPRIVHSFGITQKLDPAILEFLRKKFHIRSKVLHTKHNFHKLETTNSRSIERIRGFFLNKLKGIKSLEYKIWARSLNFKGKGKSEKLLKVQNLLRKVRNNGKE